MRGLDQPTLGHEQAMSDPNDYSNIHIESSLPKVWEQETTFNDVLYEWMSRAPWLAISAIAHLLIFLILMAIPWDLLTKKDDRSIHRNGPTITSSPATSAACSASVTTTSRRRRTAAGWPTAAGRSLACPGASTTVTRAIATPYVVGRRSRNHSTDSSTMARKST